MNNKILRLCIVMLALFFCGSLFAASPVGVWKTIDDTDGKATSYIQIYKVKGVLYGKIVKLLRTKPDARCKDCPGRFKNKKMLGMVIMWGLKKDDDVWSGGRIFSPRKKSDYRCKIWLEGPNKLKVRGYKFIFYRTQTWYRVR